MNVTVRLFAGLRREAGRAELVVALEEGARVADLLAALRDRLTTLAGCDCVVAVNRRYAPATARLREHDEVALVPPVSGGAGAVRSVVLSDAPLDTGALTGLVADDAAGAVIVFQGVTREVLRLEYEAYAEMAEARMVAIAEEEAARHGLLGVAVAHRVGAVPLREPSVVVAVSAGHRGEAFAGARAIIDRIKAEAPIWKQEVTADGVRAVPGTRPPIAP